jgi:hypothetical protein
MNKTERKAYNKRWREQNPNYTTNYFKMHYVKMKRRSLLRLEKALKVIDEVYNEVKQVN